MPRRSKETGTDAEQPCAEVERPVDPGSCFGDLLAYVYTIFRLLTVEQENQTKMCKEYPRAG